MNAFASSSRPGIRAKILPRFPSRVTAEAPVVVTKSNGNYAFTYDSTGIADRTSPDLVNDKVLVDTSIGLRRVAIGQLVPDVPVATTTVAGVVLATSDINVGTDGAMVIGTSAVTTAKIADDAVTTDKIADSNVTTDKIADANVTLAKLASSAYGTSGANKLLQLNGTGQLPALDGSNLTNVSATLPTGVPVARSYAEYTTNASLTTVLPYDDTIPQVTEGTQVLSVSHTPVSTTNRLRIRIEGFGAANGVIPMGMALFVNGASNAVRSSFVVGPASDYIVYFGMVYEYVPGSTSAQTLTVRVGPNSGAMRMNGDIAGGRKGGGTAAMTIVVEEIKA